MAKNENQKKILNVWPILDFFSSQHENVEKELQHDSSNFFLLLTL